MAGKRGMRSRKAITIKAAPRTFRRDWLQGVDRRSSLFLSMTSRLTDLMQDLGGEDNLSYQQRSLCQRAIWIEWRLLAIEDDVIRNGATDKDGLYVHLSNNLLGLYKTLGIKRQTRSLGTLKEYIEGQAE